MTKWNPEPKTRIPSTLQRTTPTPLLDIIIPSIIVTIIFTSGIMVGVLL